MKCRFCGRELPAASRFCRYCGHELGKPDEPAGGERTPEGAASSEREPPAARSGTGRTVLMIFLGLIALAASLAAILIYGQLRSANEQLSDMAALSAAAEEYSKVLDFLSSDNAGYASDEFRASRSVLVLSAGGASGEFTLVTDYDEGVSVSLTRDGGSASLEYAEDSWGYSVNMIVTPVSKGITKATFSNDLNDESFSVLIIVTE